VMVRKDESLRGDEGRCSTPGESGGGLLHMFEPLVGELEAILFVNLLLRSMVEKPHPLVGISDRKGEEEN